MQTLLTLNGRNSNQGPMHSIDLVINNGTDSAQTAFLLRSPARLVPANLLTDSDNCVMQHNPHFNSLAELQAFLKAYPTRLHVITVCPISSGNLKEQTTKAVRILTPTFSKEDIVEIPSTSPVNGGASYLLPEFYLGSNTEVELTIQPHTKIEITLQFGYYQSDRLVP